MSYSQCPVHHCLLPHPARLISLFAHTMWPVHEQVMALAYCVLLITLLARPVSLLLHEQVAVAALSSNMLSHSLDMVSLCSTCHNMLITLLARPVWLLHEQVAVAALSSNRLSQAAELIMAIEKKFPGSMRMRRIKVREMTVVMTTMMMMVVVVITVTTTTTGEPQ
eukprot:scaffold267015_cov15-Tisochrysis_lutea.AAC.2